MIPLRPYSHALHGTSPTMNPQRMRTGRMRRAIRNPREINGGRNEKTVL
ncbi:MAG: hypothetical protein WC343_09020 [Bacilli bacterium]|jgi:hypothetical protein